jgi:hypothetical protein
MKELYPKIRPNKRHIPPDKDLLIEFIVFCVFED